MKGERTIGKSKRAKGCKPEDDVDNNRSRRVKIDKTEYSLMILGVKRVERRGKGFGGYGSELWGGVSE